MTKLIRKEMTRWQVSEPETAELPLLAAMVAARVRRAAQGGAGFAGTVCVRKPGASMVTSLFQSGGLLTARENQRIVGFLGGWEIPRFLGDRNGVFVPEYGFGSDSIEPETRRTSL